MKFERLAVLGLVVALVSACSSMSDLSAVEPIRIADPPPVNANASLVKYAATIRVMPFTDARMVANPYKVGTGAVNVSGLRGKDIVLDQDVATIVTNAMKRRLGETGFQVHEEQDSIALFELSGIVKELTYNVLARDKVAIGIETTLEEISTGQVVWSGIVVEKDEHFAGVSGNIKEDVANYLGKKLDIVTTKTSDAISASLMIVHPELFNLAPGAKPVPGVTVLVAPGAPVEYGESTTAYQPRVNTSSGLLLINTIPARAKIYIDSVYYGLSPLKLELDTGVHALSVKMDGYKMTMEKVSVRKGDSTEVELKLER